MANERTFLAWNRTALALIAGGLAASSVLDLHRWLRIAVGLPPVLMGAVLAVTSYRRWQDTDAALRAGEPLPRGSAPQALAGFVAVAAVVVAVAVVVESLTR